MIRFVAIKLAAIRQDRRGITALEYGLMASFVAIAIVVGASSFGTKLSTFFTDLGNTVAGMSYKVS